MNDFNFAKKKYQTGFHRCQHYGNDGNTFLVFYVKLYDGKFHEVLQIRGSRHQIADTLKKFRLARKSINNSSNSFYSNNFPIGSLRWVACHSGKIRIFDNDIKTIYFKNPCLRKILKSTD